METKKGPIINTAEQGANQGAEWKNFSAEEALKFFQEVIPVKLDTRNKMAVFREKVAFVDGIIFGKKEEELSIAFVSSISDVQGEKKLKLSSVSLYGGGDLEYGEPVNMAQQEIEGKKYVLISQKGAGENGEKLEIIRRFSLQRG